jgi:hypothetical protein
MSEFNVTLTEGERRKLLSWANDDYNHFIRTGGGPKVTFNRKISLIDKLKRKK